MRGARAPTVAALIDVALLIAFAAVGRSAHSEGGTVRGTLEVAWPFVAAWLFVAIPSHALDRGRPRRAALAWLGAWPLALILRALTGRGDAIGFAIVLLLLPLAALTGWRAAARLVLR
ncbi:MAG: DUF3054 domain-containing protein [Gaiellales bacterium]